eukprot:9084682-Pyramimonas_sp.AAC.1
MEHDKLWPLDMLRHSSSSDPRGVLRPKEPTTIIRGRGALSRRGTELNPETAGPPQERKHDVP